MFSMAMWMLLLTAPLQIAAGDMHGQNTLQYQPAKIAAIEGHWANGPASEGVPLTLFGWPDMQQERTLDALDIPHLGSLILTHTWDGQFRGLKDFPPGDRPDSTIVFWTFRTMVGLGMLMLGLGVVGALLRWSGRLYTQRWFLRCAVAMGPAGVAAMLAGWMTTEIGRQPWVVYNVMRTAQAVSAHSAMALTVSLGLFVAVYFAVFGTGISYMLKLVAKGPERGGGTAVPAPATLRPARPLSAAPDIDPHAAGSEA
jgi:cytochrome d ubiquinol oxidase subunit I